MTDPEVPAPVRYVRSTDGVLSFDEAPARAVEVRPATAAELDALDLPPSAPRGGASRTSRSGARWSAEASLDVALPIVEDDGGCYLPEYPRCPDCGGRIAWTEAGRVPGSRRCEGATEPNMHAAGTAASPPGVSSEPDGCGSTYIDTRFGYAGPVGEREAGR